MRGSEGGGVRLNSWTATLLGGLVLVALTYFVTKFTDNIGEQQKQNDEIQALQKQAAQEALDHDTLTGMAVTIKAMDERSKKMEQDIIDLQKALNAHEQHSRLRSDHMVLPPYPEIHEHRNVRIIFSSGKWKYLAWVPRQENPNVEDRKYLKFCSDTPEPEFDGGQILDTLRYRIMRGCLSLNVPSPAYIIKRDGDGNIIRWKPRASDMTRIAEKQ